MKEIAKKEVSEIMEVDISLPQCLSAPSQGLCLCQLNIFTMPFKLLSKLIISQTTHIFPTLPWGSFPVIHSNSLQPFLDTKPLVLHELPKNGIETMWKKALQKCYLTTNRDEITEKTRTSELPMPASPCEPGWVRLREFVVTWEGQATHGTLESSLWPQFFLFQAEKPSCTWAFLSSDSENVLLQFYSIFTCALWVFGKRILKSTSQI